MDAIEFFSGIGGYSFAVKNTNIRIVQAYDMNTVANRVYHLNHNLKPNTKAIDRLSPKDIDSYNADCWLMSPPCQPFTLNGKNLDNLDNRTKPLLNLISIIPLLKRKPTFILLENVVGFKTSKTRELLLNCLFSLKYDVTEIIASPVEVGLPNNRKRYYLVARSGNGSHTELDSLPLEQACETQSISQFLEFDVDISKYLVPEEYILRRGNFRFGTCRIH
jgi:tRNA (cytosine38-C5)-methyltransferase